MLIVSRLQGEERLATGSPFNCAGLTGRLIVDDSLAYEFLAHLVPLYFQHQFLSYQLILVLRIIQRFYNPRSVELYLNALSLNRKLLLGAIESFKERFAGDGLEVVVDEEGSIWREELKVGEVVTQAEGFNNNMDTALAVESFYLWSKRQGRGD